MIIEIIIGSLLGLVLVALWLMAWNKLKLKKLKKNYDEKEDKSKQGELRRFSTDHKLEGVNFERGRIPTTAFSDVGKNSPRSRKKKRDVRRRFG